MVFGRKNVRTVATLHRYPFVVAGLLGIVVAGAMVAADVVTDKRYVVAVISPTPLLYHPPHEYPSSNTALSTLQPGENVKVLRVRYGKDFEALQVERSSGESGWVFSGGAIEVLSRGGER